MRSLPRFWLDVYFDLFGGRYIEASVFTAAFIFALGAGAAWVIDFHKVYLQTVPIYLGVFGIAWVGCWCGWASRRSAQMFEDLRGAFVVDEVRFQQLSHYWMRKLFDARVHIGGAAVLILLAWLAVALATQVPERLSVSIPWLENNAAWFEEKSAESFPKAWSQEPDLWVKNGIIGVYAIPVALLIFTGGAGIVTYAWFVTSISKLPMVPFLELTRAKLRPIADFGIVTGLVWSVGVSLIVALTRQSFDPVSAGVVASLTGLGVVMVFWPQYAVHSGLSRTKQAVVAMALARASLSRPDPPDVQILDSRGNPLTVLGQITPEQFVRYALEPQNQQLDVFTRSVVGASTWIYRPADAFILGGTWLLPLATLAFTQWV